MSGISGEELLEVGGGFVIFNDNVGLAIPTHPYLFEFNLRSFVRGVENIVVGSIELLGEFIWGYVTAQMIRATCGDMDCAEDLLILDIPSAERKELRAESELA